MLKKVLSVIATGIEIFLVISVVAYLITGHRILIELTTSMGILNTIHNLPWAIKLIVIVMLISLVTRYGKMYRYFNKE